MGKTNISIKGEDFYINGRLVYEEIETSKKECHGLLMNARFIQGIFDDKADVQRFNRFGVECFDPEKHTDGLIESLPQWYDFGLRAITVGFQGGGPCFTIENNTIINNPFSEDGNEIDPAYLSRMDRVVKAADEIGMVVIVSYFYPGQINNSNMTGTAILNSVRTASRYLKKQGYTNVIIEICNEYNLTKGKHPIVGYPDGMSALIQIAREESGGMLVGSSGMGGYIDEEVCKASDIIFIHANDQPRQKYYNLIRKARRFSPGKPVVCNEDSQAVSQLEVAYKTRSSWGYYNNLTKQEPPADFGITKGEDLFFAHRMAEMIGINVAEIPFEDQFYFQGFEENIVYDNSRWLRVASLYPEIINYVDFYKEGKLVYTCYEDPFTLYFNSNWHQGKLNVLDGKGKWEAKIHLRDGRVIVREGYIA